MAALRRIAAVLAAGGLAGLVLGLGVLMAPVGSDLPQVAAYAETPVAVLALTGLSGAVAVAALGVLWLGRHRGG